MLVDASGCSIVNLPSSKPEAQALTSDPSPLHLIVVPPAVVSPSAIRGRGTLTLPFALAQPTTPHYSRLIITRLGQNIGVAVNRALHRWHCTRMQVVLPLWILVYPCATFRLLFTPLFVI